MDYIFIVANIIVITIVLTQSYNLVLGYTGMIHIGHVAFMAIGAYTSALLTIHGVPFWYGFLGGIIASGIAGLLLALPTVRFRDDYLVAATLGIGEIVKLILLNERWLTGGSDGLTKIPNPTIFGYVLSTQFSLFLFNFVITIFVMLFVYGLVSSPFGKVLESIREDEIGAKTLGKNTVLIKIQILVIGAMLAGLSGTMYAHFIQFIEPDIFNLHEMIFVFLAVILGGSGTFWGPAVGTTVLLVLYELMRLLPLPPYALGPTRWIFYSIILIIIVILKPRGIMGERVIRKKL